MFSTISSSTAPSSTATSASNDFTSDLFVPNGNPITVQTPKSFPRIWCANATFTGVTHADEKLYSTTSLQSFIISSLVASGFIFVWSIICLLYTSDAADEEDSVDLGGR